jgi:hypothetical protein
LVDILDLHYYPQTYGQEADGNWYPVSLSSNDGPGTQAARLRSVKSLYDPTYTDESWINSQINLLPWLQSIIANWNPGMQIGITEYNWGNDDINSGAVANAEALAIFGREGVSMANRWGAPGVSTYGEQAFKIYLNYDGEGSNALNGSSVLTSSSNVDTVGAYTIIKPGKVGSLYNTI